MSISKVTAGEKLPHEFNVIIEIPMNADPIKYEVDEESGALFVDRFMTTAMRYPANYGYVPRTLAADKDPVDVLVHTPFPLHPGVVVRCRPLGVLRMEDEAGGDAKCSRYLRTTFARYFLTGSRSRMCPRRVFRRFDISSSTTRTSSPASGYASSAGRTSRPRTRRSRAVRVAMRPRGRPRPERGGRDRPLPAQPRLVALR